MSRKRIKMYSKTYEKSILNGVNASTDNGYIEGKELDHFFRHMMTKLGPEVSTYIFPSLIFYLFY